MIQPLVCTSEKSYERDDKNNVYEVHREYLKDRVAIFCEHLEPGTYEFEVNLLPRFSGSFTLNPARIEHMYFPVFNANNESLKILIK